MDLLPIILSLKIAAVSTVFTFFIGMYAAWKTANIMWGKGILDAIFTLPMVLPPTVTGFFLLIFFGKSSTIGKFLAEIDFDMIFFLARRSSCFCCCYISFNVPDNAKCV